MNFKVGQWVMALKDQPVPDRYKVTPQYIHNIRTKDNGEVILDISSDPDDIHTESWFAKRFKLSSPGQEILNKRVRIA